MPQSIGFHTLGCKLNQLETEGLAASFRGAGFDIAEAGDKSGSVHFVNTCTVTSKAEQKARRLIRSLLDSSPDAIVVVTGCYAQVAADALAQIDARVFVVPGDAKASLLELPPYLLAANGEYRDSLDAIRAWFADSGKRLSDPFAFKPEDFSFHSRASLKVEDGCDNHCAYCLVRIARGKAKSLDSEIVLERARELEARGFAEIVLTGVNLSQYRGPEGFPGLLKKLVEGTKSVAFRLSSYEPDKVDSPFLESIASNRVRPHFHLAIQSGSDSILSRMGRHYGREGIFSAVEAIRQVRADPFIAFDVIAGFPGEGEAEFQDTLDLVKKTDPAWIHAFPFSPRPGTEAFDMKPHIPERESVLRVAQLEGLAEEGKRRYAQRYEGRVVEAIAESSRDKVIVCTSENYLKLALIGSGPVLPGSALHVLIKETLKEGAHLDLGANYIQCKGIDGVGEVIST